MSQQRKMSPQQIERQLGMQYARLLQETKGAMGSVTRETEDISRYLELLCATNKASLGLQTKRVAGAFA